MVEVRGRGYGCVRGDATGISWVESRVAARHPTMYRAAFLIQRIWHQMPIMLLLRNARITGNPVEM